jgi:SAM-dependent methyltransferase
VADRITGSILDVGCGTGENALYFASRGHKVTGIDFLEEPINRARKKATERRLSATFFVMDAVALKDLPEVFDNVIDSGLFHVFSDEDRRRYVEGLATVLKPGGRLFLLCFSDEEPGDARAEAGAEEGTARRLRRGLERGVHRTIAQLPERAERDGRVAQGVGEAVAGVAVALGHRPPAVLRLDGERPVAGAAGPVDDLHPLVAEGFEQLLVGARPGVGDFDRFAPLE